MLFQKLQVSIHVVFLCPMKKWHVYQRKHINTSTFYTTKIQICPQKFWNPATLSFFSLKSHFSKIKSFSLSSFFSLESESHLSQIFNSNLRHALTQIPFQPKPAPPNYAVAPLILFLSFTLPSTAPLQYLSILSPTTIKSHPHLIFHINIFILFIYLLLLFFIFIFFATERTKEINIQVQRRWVPFNFFFFFFNFKPIFFLGLFVALSLKFFGFNLNCIVAKTIASIWF